MGPVGGGGTSGGAYPELICLARWSVCVPVRAAGGAALSAGPIDAVAHLGVRLPGGWGSLVAPAGAAAATYPSHKKPIYFLYAWTLLL